LSPVHSTTISITGTASLLAQSGQKAAYWRDAGRHRTLLIYDQVENLDRIIPSFEKQLAESLKQPALAHK